MTCYHLQAFCDFVTPEHKQPHIPLLLAPKNHREGERKPLKGIKNQNCTQRCKILPTLDFLSLKILPNVFMIHYALSTTLYITLLHEWNGKYNYSTQP